MNESELENLLRKCIAHYWYVTQLEKCATNSERAKVLAHHFGGYGGNSTSRLLSHYGEGLDSAILKELDKNLPGRSP